MGEGGPRLHARVVHYRDNGRLRSVRIESTDPAEVERYARLYRRLERADADAERRYQKRTATFTDAAIDPDGLVDLGALPPSKGGYPWEGPRYSFALLLGESPTWDGPRGLVELAFVTTDALGNKAVERAAYGIEATGPADCPFCAAVAELPPYAACLGCCRTGRDAVIPRGQPRTRARAERADGLKGGQG